MSAFSSDVLSVYRPAGGSDVADTRYEVVPGSCWFRGIVFFTNADFSGVTNLWGINLFFNLYDGQTGPLKFSLPFGSQNWNFSEFLIPDECYIDFDDGIWVGAVTFDEIIQSLYMTMFYSQ